MKRDEQGRTHIGCWASDEQLAVDGFARGILVPAFADFVLSNAVSGKTRTISVDYSPDARVGNWIDAEINERDRTDTLIFADAVVRSVHGEVARINGVFTPVGNSEVEE